MSTYKIVRFYMNHTERLTLEGGLTLDEAQAHCQDPETSSSTATKPKALAHTEAHGPWFDAYTEE